MFGFLFEFSKITLNALYLSFKGTTHLSLLKISITYRSGYIEQGTIWKQISNHIFSPKDTSLESEKIEGIWGGTKCGGQNAPKFGR